MTVDGNELAVSEYLRKFGNAVDTWDSQFACDDGTMDEHPAAAFDNSARQRNQVSHHGLNSVANEHVPGSETLQIAGRLNDADTAPGYPGRSRLADQLTWLVGEISGNLETRILLDFA